MSLHFFSSLHAGVSSLQLHRGANACDISKPDLSEADMIVFLGDFNYRLRDISYDEARDLVSQRCFDWLREKDQLRAEMAEGKVFQGLREAHIKFPPTYKFDRHQTGLSGYDSGEKKRIPAWCDRILYRDSRPVTIAECSLSCPVVSSIIQYEACLEVTGSDHKPVRCMLTVDIARVDELTRRKQFGEIVSSNETVRMLVDEFRNVPETTVSTNEIDLPKQDMSLFSITNKCSKDVAVFVITCAGHSTVNKGERSSDVRPSRPFGFPSWLKVVPVAGIIKSGQTTEIFLRHEDYHTHTLEDLIDEGSQNGCVDDNSEEVMLTVRITGRWSTESKCHKVCVRQCSSSAISESNSKLTRNQSRRH